jgi:catechol 2,3-dioxygenase-like lactoylglutathione lyase family enzyme
MSTAMFRGVDHVGLGVGDLDRALAFYGGVGFSELVFAYEGVVPGLEFLGGRDRTARVAMVANPAATPVGPGRLKLVQVLDGDGPPPAPAGQGWGEIGVCEICLHVRGVQQVHDRLVADLGARSLMAPLSGAVSPNDVSLDIAYVADPWGGKIELIEWTGLWHSLPGPPRAEGVNHVAFGVSDVGASRAFYGRLGFTELLFESTEFFTPMASWYERELPGQHMFMTMAAQGAAIEPCRLTPLGPDCRGDWGHLGPMEFAIGVSNLEAALPALRAGGAAAVGEPQQVEVEGGEWRYAYFAEPDGNYVSLVEARY